MIERWVEEGRDELEQYGGHTEARVLLGKSYWMWEESSVLREVMLHNKEKVLRTSASGNYLEQLIHVEFWRQ